MIGVTTKITRNDFRKLAEAGQAAARRRNLELANVAAEVAKELCPIRTGALRASIRVEQGQSGSVVRVIAGNELVNYAPFVEFGTRFMSPQPFMTPANDYVRAHTANRAFKMY